MAKNGWRRPKLTVLIRADENSILSFCKVHPYLSGGFWSPGCTVVLRDECFVSTCPTGRQCEPGCEPAIPGGSPGDAFWSCKIGYCADQNWHTRWCLVQPNYTFGGGS